MKDHLSTSTESHLNALCDLVYSQKKQLENQRERIQLQKEHIQLQKETLLLQKQELIDVRSLTANGEFIWRIPDFTRKLMDAKSGRAPEPMISEPFYTHPHGYKMCAGLWLNGVGTGRGRYISVGLQVSSDQVHYASGDRSRDVIDKSSWRVFFNSHRLSSSRIKRERESRKFWAD